MIGRRSQRDFEDEIRSHLQLEVDRLCALGMSPAEAERTARRNFGNIGVAQDRFHDGQRLAALVDAVRDLRHGWRALLRSPGFLATAAGTLALAIGATVSMFGVVNTVLLTPLPFPQPERLVSVSGTAPGSDLPERYELGMEFYLHYRESSQLIDGMFIFDGGTSTFRTDDRVERVRMAWPTNDIYATFGVQPQLGRLPREEDGSGVVVISDAMWTTWFGRDPSVIGRSYDVSGASREIIGVMPPSFRFPEDNTMLWIATPAPAEGVQPGQLGSAVVARLREGATSQQLADELTRLSRDLPGRFGGTPQYARFIEQHRTVVHPLLNVMVPSTVRASLWVLLAAAAVVLLIACANVGNLLLARSESRRRDLTVRRAIGASRAQLFRFQMAEVFALALMAGVFAVLLAAVTLPLFLSAAPEGIPRLGDVTVDAPMLGAAFGLVILVTIACGIVPAFRASRPDLSGLREGGRGGTVRHRGRDLLVAAQTALALLLLIGSALLLQSFQRLRDVDPGYDIDDIYTFQFAPQQPHLNDGPSFGRLHLEFMERLRSLPGTTAVGVVNNIPLDEGTGGLRVRTESMNPGADAVLLDMNFTGGEYFGAMGTDVLRGRAFIDDEAISPNTSVILSQSAARRLWPDAEAVGNRIRPVFGGQDTLAFTVVGVVEDVKQDDWRQAGEAVVYFPLTGPTPDSWAMGSPAYVIRSSFAASLQPQVRALVRDIAPEAPVYREYTMEFLARRSMIQLTFTTLTLGVVSVLALILGIVGLYGVLAYVVAQRTREIGVRMALGATAGLVRRQIVAQGMKVVLLGTAAGVVAALASTKWLDSLLYEVSAAEPSVFVAMALLMMTVGALASYVPARRASSVPPNEALRSD